MLVALAVFAVGALGFSLLVAASDRLDMPWVGTKQLKAIGRYEGTSPFDLAPIDGEGGPILTADDVTDIDARYVTDPFVVGDGSDWFMFLGVRRDRNNRGAIGLATTPDGQTWQYEGLVLEESYHTSYPHVFAHDGEYYMTPESADSGAVRLYRAEEFPTSWVLESVLLEGEFTDPTPFEHEGRWWMFAGARPKFNDELRLYMADDVAGPWVEHPSSPIVDGDASTARPGGRVLRLDDRIYRVTQDDDPTYGNGLWAFEILELTPTDYREQRVGSEQILTAGDESWNNQGLGHLDVAQTAPGRWVGYVSGQGESSGIGPSY